ncbi:hypothetical protein [Pararoseomonas baculiformis]|nr:hypothetical protein [Pararoseomonas baculiformis]
MHSTNPEDALEHAVTEALDRILSRMPHELRVDALRSLRAELERCLAEAPVSGDPVDAIRMRARFSAAVAAFGPSEGRPLER